MLIHKRVQLVYAAVDDYVQALFDRGVLGDLLGGERFGHGGGASAMYFVRVAGWVVGSEEEKEKRGGVSSGGGGLRRWFWGG